jgi:hypothetical protein
MLTETILERIEQMQIEEGWKLARVRGWCSVPACIPVVVE